MTYPSIEDYNSSCFSRRRFFRLSGKRYRFVRSARRFVFSSGAFACVVKLASCDEFGKISEDVEKGKIDKDEAKRREQETLESSPEDLEFHAVRLLTREQPDLVRRYRALSDFVKRNPGLSSLLLETTVYEGEFNYRQSADLSHGEIERRDLLPVIRMEWCSGTTLGSFVAQSCKRGDVENLSAIRGLVAGLARECRRAQFVHGDLSPENILVLNNQGELELRLVDYDSVLFPGIEDLSSPVGLTQMRHPDSTERGFDDDLVALAIYDLVFAFLIEHHADLVGLNDHVSDDQATVDGLFEQRFVLSRDDFLAAPEDRSRLAKKVHGFAPNRFDQIRACLLGPYEDCGDLADFAVGVIAVGGVFLQQDDLQTSYLDEFFGWISDQRFELWTQEPNFLIRPVFDGVVVYKFFASEMTFDDAKDAVEKGNYSLPDAVSHEHWSGRSVDAHFLARDPRLADQWIWFGRSPDTKSAVPWFGRASENGNPFTFARNVDPSARLLAVGKRKFDSKQHFLASERRVWHERILYSCPIDISLARPTYFARLKNCLDQLFDSLVRRREFVEMLWQGIEVGLFIVLVENSLGEKVRRDHIEGELERRLERLTRYQLPEKARVKAEVVDGMFRFVRV